MKVVSVREAKTHLSRLLKQVAAGEDVVIAKAGRPVARLVPVAPSAGKRLLGSERGKFVVPGDFDAPLSERTLAEFES